MQLGLKDYRKSLGITISQASSAVGVSLRTYNRYEQDDDYGDPLKKRNIWAFKNQIWNNRRTRHFKSR